MADDAVICWISGPALRARTSQPFQVNEAVLVGPRRLLGEVIHIRGDEIVVQVYDDTSGLSPGDAVQRSGLPLSVRLGPGLLGHIFDGLLRPLPTDADFVAPGMRSAAPARFLLQPLLAVGDCVEPGAVLGTLGVEACLAPPHERGTIQSIAMAGEYSDWETIAVIRRDDGSTAELSMTHRWPVREPRPVLERLPVD